VNGGGAARVNEKQNLKMSGLFLGHLKTRKLAVI
jgi:hypothetical protein